MANRTVSQTSARLQEIRPTYMEAERVYEEACEESLAAHDALVLAQLGLEAAASRIFAEHTSACTSS